MAASIMTVFSSLDGRERDTRMWYATVWLLRFMVSDMFIPKRVGLWEVAHGLVWKEFRIPTSSFLAEF